MGILPLIGESPFFRKILRPEKTRFRGIGSSQPFNTVGNIPLQWVLIIMGEILSEL